MTHNQVVIKRIDSQPGFDRVPHEHVLDADGHAPELLRQGFVSESAAVSIQGKGRTRNEDAYLCALPVLAVADGVGGKRADYLASWLAVGALAGPFPGEPSSELLSAFREAQSAIRSLASNESFAGAATTLTATRFIPGGMWVAHLGDSCAYRLRGGNLEQLTSGHTFVAELLHLGVIDAAEAARHPRRSTLTSGLGLDTEYQPDLFKVALAPGDTVVLCTDGLSKTVGLPEIIGALSGSNALPSALENLVGIGHKRASVDITVVPARIAAA